jgi:hypothetical protein
LVSTGGTSLSPDRVADKTSVVANALGIFVIIVYARENTAAIAKITIADLMVLIFFMLYTRYCAYDLHIVRKVLIL